MGMFIYFEKKNKDREMCMTAMKVFLDADNKHFCLTTTTFKHVINYDKKLFFSSKKSWFKIEWKQESLTRKWQTEWNGISWRFHWKKIEQSKMFIKLWWNDKQRRKNKLQTKFWWTESQIVVGVIGWHSSSHISHINSHRIGC